MLPKSAQSKSGRRDSNSRLQPWQHSTRLNQSTVSSESSTLTVSGRCQPSLGVVKNGGSNGGRQSPNGGSVARRPPPPSRPWTLGRFEPAGIECPGTRGLTYPPMPSRAQPTGTTRTRMWKLVPARTRKTRPRAPFQKLQEMQWSKHSSLFDWGTSTRPEESWRRFFGRSAMVLLNRA